MISPIEIMPEADPAILVSRPEHQELREVVRSLLTRTADHESVRRAAYGELGFNGQVWDRLNRELGVSSMLIPESFGGSGFGLRDMAVVLEETGAALLPEPVLFSSVLAAYAVASAEEGALVADVLAGLASGELIGTVALVEPVDFIIEAGHATGRLERVVAGATADLVVFRTPDGVHLVRREQPGFQAITLEVLDATRRQADLRLDGVVVTTLVGSAKTDHVWSRLTRLGTIAVAAEHVGMIRTQLEATVKYVGQRQQFGRAIGSFQAVKHRLADVFVDLERSRSAVEYAAALFDRESDAPLAAQVAGAVTTDAVMCAVHESVQLHGGIGFTWEHPAHYYLKRALGDEGIFGAGRAHRARIADLIGV